MTCDDCGCDCGHDCTSVETETYQTLPKSRVDIDQCDELYEISFTAFGNGTTVKVGKTVLLQLREKITQLRL